VIENGRKQAFLDRAKQLVSPELTEQTGRNAHVIAAKVCRVLEYHRLRFDSLKRMEPQSDGGMKLVLTDREVFLGQTMDVSGVRLSNH